MQKLILQFSVIICLFFGLWFMIDKINWMKIFHVKQVTDKTEKKLGDMCWDLIKKDQEEIKNQKIEKTIDSILTRICDSNKIDKSNIKIHLLKSDEINAFALPDNHLVIYSSLITSSNNEAQFSGVICHEVAHMEMSHVMKKLIKEVGLSAIISVTNSNGTGAVLKGVAKTLSSTAYDRTLEKEADIKAVDYLIKSNIDPTPFAQFLEAMDSSSTKKELQLTWFSTHPDSKERGKYLRQYFKNKSFTYKPILATGSWSNLKSEIAN